MPLDPQARAFLDMVANMPPLDTRTVEENRAQLAGVVPLTGTPAELASVTDVTLPGPAGDVRVRVYRPGTEARLPVVAYFHGGGWMLCDLETHDTTCRDIARHAGAVVVAVDYRRSPEHPFPAAYEDCLAVTRALLDGSAGLGTDGARVAVAVDRSASGCARRSAAERPGLQFPTRRGNAREESPVGSTYLRATISRTRSEVT
jgi:acetyl esterase